MLFFRLRRVGDFWVLRVARVFQGFGGINRGVKASFEGEGVWGFGVWRVLKFSGLGLSWFSVFREYGFVRFWRC